MKRIALALFAIAAVVPTSVAHAGWETAGDSRLVVEPGICDLYRSQNPSYCGPTLSLRVPPLLMNGDGVWVYVDLTGPAGPVALEYGRSASISNGRLFIDSDYWQNKTQTGTPTGLPFGTYTYKWNYTKSGQWTCSKYNKNGCSWSDDVSITYTYVFDWQGAKLETYPVQGKVPVVSDSLNDFSARRSTTISAVKAAKKMLITKGYMYQAGDTATVKRLSGTACKVTANTIKTSKRGKCRIQLTAVTPTGWKYIFKFNIQVK
jgi:hypothetical protein